MVFASTRDASPTPRAPPLRDHCVIIVAARSQQQPQALMLTTERKRLADVDDSDGQLQTPAKSQKTGGRDGRRGSRRWWGAVATIGRLRADGAS
jgi:hypothetical protein